jgi:hypothetical protein
LATHNYKIGGHSVTYDGHYAVAFRVDTMDNLIAFSGRKSRAIKVDGKLFTFADRPIDAIAWAPVEPVRRIDPGVRLQIKISGTDTVHIPAAWLSPSLRLYSEGQIPGSRGEAVGSSFADGMLVLKATQENSGRWIYGVISDASSAKD